MSDINTLYRRSSEKQFIDENFGFYTGNSLNFYANNFHITCSIDFMDFGFFIFKNKLKCTFIRDCKYFEKHRSVNDAYILIHILLKCSKLKLLKFSSKSKCTSNFQINLLKFCLLKITFILTLSH